MTRVLRGVRALGALSFVVLLSALVGCGAPAENQAEEAAPGMLRLGRQCEIDGGRYSLDARFDVTGPEVLELATDPTSRSEALVLAAGSYTTTIRSDFSVWRDVAVARLQVAAQLASDAEQAFEITSGVSTLVAYDFMVEGEMVTFDLE
jgi:hypothetical protein